MSISEMRRQIKKYIDEADSRVVKMVYAILEADRQDDSWVQLPNEVQQSIIIAEKELSEGKGISHEVMMKKYKKWLAE